MSKKNNIHVSGSGNMIIQDVNKSHIKISGKKDNKKQSKHKSVKKKKILIIESQPDTLTNTDANKGISSMIQVWKNGKYRNEFKKPNIELATNREVFLHILNNVSPDILHLSLHTHKEKGLIFTDEYGDEDYMSKNEFEKKIKFISEEKPLELVFINSCNSSVYAEAIHPYADYTIGMTDFIPTELANLFATAFYKSFFDHKNIEKAFKTAVLEIEFNNDFEMPEDITTAKENIPKLYKK